MLKPAFTAVAKALEAVGSPWTKLRAALHLEVAKAEADADSFMKVCICCHNQAQGCPDLLVLLGLNPPGQAWMPANVTVAVPSHAFLTLCVIHGQANTTHHQPTPDSKPSFWLLLVLHRPPGR